MKLVARIFENDDVAAFDLTLRQERQLLAAWRER